MEKEYIKGRAGEYFHIPKWTEIPNIDLYMDQAVTLLEEYLRPFTLDSDEKVITKTMINNYVKQCIIKMPVNKKYSKDHIATLFVICILKQVYSINDISELIKLSFKNNDTQTAYNKFCNELQMAIEEIFEEKVCQRNSLSDDQYILKYVVQSFVSKLYVEKEYLMFKKNNKKKDNNKEKKKIKG